ncbi:DUF305 domain-containing protein [Planotetraspora mira]|uniref:DUF305 domain-containing protein n=1 Tax=Planotetraspora mira TaxID=58121 RepID=A0A8J3X5M7_9ACTN|nr:DUF305 domain-containing protein [Planotetraspora mira]GII28670.1 hypothetical protein Pmi06nite_21120 [Planotetraspora mira]
MKRSLTVMAAAVGIVVASSTGCSAVSGSAAYGQDAAAAPAADKGKAGHNDADVRFSQEMIPHHWQTIQIAALASERGSDSYVKTLAKEITEHEAADIRVMSGWLRSWQVEVPSGDIDMGHDMPGMISKTQILALEGRSGADFDRLWLSVLAKHLDAGVAMAEKAAGSGEHQGTKDLANKIVKTQRAEIEQIVDHLQ